MGLYPQTPCSIASPAHAGARALLACVQHETCTQMGATGPFGFTRLQTPRSINSLTNIHSGTRADKAQQLRRLACK
jgi:hypothetical protein